MTSAQKGLHELAPADEDRSDDERSDTSETFDRDDDDDDRSDRFVDSSAETSHMFKSKSLNELKPFYNGATLDERMAEIRKSIVYIREHWSEYDQFMVSLRALMEESGMEFKDAKTTEHAEAVLRENRDWLTDVAARESELEFHAIKLYTSKEGYARIYRVSNNIFRKEDSVMVVEKIRSVVFLVELINIDLYNYCLKYPDQANFEGIVYRGMCLSQDDHAAFHSLRNEPIGRRNIAIPLGLLSSSSKIKTAKKFIDQQLKQQAGADVKPMLFKINVIGLPAKYVEHYRKSFPTTVMTTICAVDIHKLSRHKRENEVLLRGPFFLILDLYEDDGIIQGTTCSVLEIVMLNANRDHISTSLLGDQGDAARDMFGTMVTVTRSEFALKYCETKGFAEDATEYRKILQDNQEKLRRIMGQ